ncbi:NUDIX domain-containing protein [Paenibacillus sp. JX-17]|uniref:NUDIX domain-containing protein n=1 Tax=Paenibacillus lacisoli TaxID=3064525 RepID=A0ABT9CGN6_9BACL|nr:NUDIX domain-containing protein [Paenibacillus sp. JX-17]MDO7908065.1 NUDIX domain-containing protein [Paenibacillus sp. JX-17]
MSDQLDTNGFTERQFLEQYDASQFDRPSVTVDMLIFTVANQVENNYRKLPPKTLQLLLIKRGEHPYLGHWALPGGFVQMNESLDEAAARELRSETNIDQIYMEQLYTWGDVQRDPRTRVISCSYMALVDSHSLLVQAGEDADEAAWFDLTYQVLEEKKVNRNDGHEKETTIELRLQHNDMMLNAVIKITNITKGRNTRITREVMDSSGLAFDHARMIQYGLERLQNKIEYTDIAFNLMAERFTLSELQQVYEIILGRDLLAAAFRRKVTDLVEPTDEYTKEAGHRPSRLYRYRS